MQYPTLPEFDLLQIHTWNDDWTDDDSWSDMLDALKRQGLIRATGISINRWEPWNGVQAVRSGKIDSVQVIYNIFDQNPEDQLFPACEEMNVAVIARVPLDEGTLTGTMTKDTTFPEDDWRSTYFAPENLVPSVERADALKSLVPDGSSMADMALRFILGNPTVATIIPGMRKLANVENNVAASDRGPLSAELQEELRSHRWVRKPAPWSD
jgi:aryl-alcohol dehydrogenase-like predicted oxidoreductase